MRLSVMVLGFVCLCAVVIGVAAPAMQDEDVRGAFLTSRPKEKPATSGSATRPSRKPPRQPPASNKPGKSPEKQPEKPETSGSTSTGPSKAVNLPRLGLGLTLFMRDSNGMAVRAEPGREFSKGDRVRVLLETNADGYLYIFNTTNDGPAIMIYPDANLDEGGNYLQAHVPFEIPSSLSTEERLRWFAFDENAGTEKLFIVFTREPLKGIPIADELLTFCRDSKDSCPIRPAAEVWAVVQKEMQEPLKIDKAQVTGTPETTTEARGLGLSKDDPPPSVVMMASTRRPTLVATLDLIHK